MSLTLKPLKIKQEDGVRMMYFEPKEFYELIQNNPDADVIIVAEDGSEIRTFNTKLIYDGLYLNPRSE
jgi:hypothetical protein